jgi:hypothetical protein
VLVAEVDVIPSNGPLPPGKADAVLRFNDPATSEEAATFLRESIGPCVEGTQNNVITARPLDQIKPVRLVLQADTVPTAKALVEFFPHRPMPHDFYNSIDPSYFQVNPAGSNAFRVLLKSPVHSAAEYLALSQQAVPDLGLLSEALKRPCAWMDSDYQRPFVRPIPNFVRMRTVAQLLAQRAKCYLLLGQPESAWHELALVRDMCHMLEAKPASNCPRLVETMIDVAIAGLYTSIIQDGLRLHAWREPELVTAQKQLVDINLLPLLRTSFSAERAAVCRTFETYTPTEFYKWFTWFNPLGAKPGLWARLQEPRSLLISLMPRGWIYQNMCAVALRDQLIIDSFELPNNQVLPREVDDTMKEIETTFSGFSPHTWLAAIVTPNFAKAIRVMARNQTLVNEAFLACGLERYRLAHGQYPDSLDALVPQFAAKLPHDIIGGQPIKYHRTADGRFVLYSVGWNGKDDSGVAGKSVEEGDWVWE